MDNKILKREELEEVYNVPISQLSYNSLVSSIPLKWKLIIKNSISIIQNLDHCYVTKLAKSILKTNNKEIYSKLTYSNEIPTSQNKWVEYYPFLDVENWGNIYTLHTKFVK